MSRLSSSSIAVLTGISLLLAGSLYLAFSDDKEPILAKTEEGADTASLPTGFLDRAEPTGQQIDLTLDPAAINQSNPLSISEPRAGVLGSTDLPGSSVRVDLAPQRFSDDEIVVKPYVGAGVDVDGAGEEGGFLGADGLAADLKGKAEAGSKIEITKSLEMQLGYEVNETLGSTGGATSGMGQDKEERVQGGLSLKF
ncbi:MAG: hypothetical protein KUG61_07945 [Parvibaculaceae bacterium]|nr:hypothetical protein [Parvibaculaceae bacterium]